ncbi:helix-turn-helix domain-containing protein [Treponema primitia]|uniref:helix-turn-helix domain-containing protein n=1 Tax=Treponema primitia TaxID=88058 RepID=UPI0002555762|nr:helix-turn-helix domain-containing protein [Treponema primitia]
MAVYSKQETAKLLGIAPVTLDRLRRRKSISFRKVGSRVLFTQADIDQFLEQSLVPSAREVTPCERK